MGLEDVVLYGIVLIAIVLLVFCFFGATNLCNPFTQLTRCTWLADCLDCAGCCGIARNRSSLQNANVVKEKTRSDLIKLAIQVEEQRKLMNGDSKSVQPGENDKQGDAAPTPGGESPRPTQK